VELENFVTGASESMVEEAIGDVHGMRDIVSKKTASRVFAYLRGMRRIVKS
jgi:hypothetical protein